MTILGIILTAGVFDQLIGLLIIIYSVIEIIDYIYFKVKNKDLEELKTPTKKEKKNNKVKRLKKGKVIDAVIEEE